MDDGLDTSDGDLVLGDEVSEVTDMKKEEVLEALTEYGESPETLLGKDEDALRDLLRSRILFDFAASSEDGAITS